jgi:asparagine synthase (glutamine-hydrolysing)
MVSQLLREVLSDHNAPIFDIVNKERLAALLREEDIWPWYGQLMKGPQTIAYMLQLNFWLKHYKVRIDS